MVIAPHVDDESLGAGGTLLKLAHEGFDIAWVIVTNKSEEFGWPKNEVEERVLQIKKVSKFLSIKKVYELGFMPAGLDTVPNSKIVSEIYNSINDFQPYAIFIPHVGDVHTDHGTIFHAAISASKSFRSSSVKLIMSYETLSETEYGLEENKNFNPNLFIDISDYIDKKIELIKIYSRELDDFPFPRSEDAISALAKLRGSQSANLAAEAFKILKLIS